MSKFTEHGRRKFPAGMMPPRNERERANYELHYYDVPALPQAPSQRKTISDVDQRLEQARAFANTPRLRYIPHPDRPGGRIEPIVQPQRTATPQPQPTNPIERTAFEEAGHAVANDDIGWRVTSLCVREDGSGSSDADHRVDPTPSGADKMRKKAIVLLAGMAAQKRRYGNYVESATDIENVRLSVLLLGLEGAEAAAFVADARKQAEAIVAKRWSDVEKVAAVLAVVRQMDGQHFYQCIGKSGPAVQVRRIELPLQTRSAAVTASGDDIKICWGTGEMVKRSGFNGTYLEDLPPANADLTWMNSGKCPILDSHNSDRVSDILGIVQENSAFVKDGRGYATIKLGPNAPRDAIDAGTMRNISIGYSVGAMKRNGEAADGTPVMTVTAYRILECSIVGIPADKGAEILRKYPAEVRG